MLFRWRESSWMTRLLAVACLATMSMPAEVSAQAGNAKNQSKLDQQLERQANRLFGRSRVIITLKPGVDASQHVKALGGRLVRKLELIDSIAVDLPNAQLRRLAQHSDVISIHHDRPVGGDAHRASVVIGAQQVRDSMGFDGAGVGVAVIDSGVSAWHDDLTYTGTSSLARTSGGQRVVGFVDFVNDRRQSVRRQRARDTRRRDHRR